MNVSLFIDYHPASQQEIMGMRTKDVVRVEYYDNPTDPRFQGSRAVVNFIMKKYEYRGYLKATAGQSFFYNAGDYRLYSKINHKQMTYDISLGGKYSIDNGKASISLNNYNFVDDNGDNFIVQRMTEGEGRDKNHSLYASFRARYMSDKMSISNEVGLSRGKTSYSFINGKLSFNSVEIGDYSNSSTSQSLSPYFSGNYFFVLSDKSSLSAIINFSYSRNKAWQDYFSSYSDPIINNSAEHVYSPVINVNYNYNLGHNNSLNLELWSIGNIYKSDYTGSFVGKQSFITTDHLIMPSYNHRIGQKISLYARLGLMVSTFDVNGNKYSQVNPRIGGQLAYTINNKNNLNFQFWLASSNVPFSYINDVLMQVNEIEWKQGNNNLKGMPWYMTTLTYTWLPSNKFNLSSSSYFECYTDKFMPIYTQEGDRMIVKYVNQGGWIRLRETLQATYRPIKEITLSGWCMYGNYFCYDGNYARVSKVMGGANAIGYWKNFSLNLFYRTEITDLGTRSEKVTIPHQYGLILSYGNSNWHAQLNVINIFDRQNYRNTIVDVSNFSSNETIYSNSGGRSISLTVSYTLDFGKKINRGDELQAPTGGKSAVMKAEE